MSADTPRLSRGQQALLEAALPKVRAMARDFAAVRPDTGEDDLYAAGAAAATQAVLRFDPERNPRFDVFCWKHVFFAMLRCLHANRPAAREAIGKAQRAGLMLAATLTEAPTAFDHGPDALDACIADFAGDVALGMIAELDEASVAPEDALIDSIDRGRLSAAVEREVVQLPARERQLFDLRFRKRRSLQKVAAALGISKATAGRWCRALRDRLRRNLAEQGYVETRPRAAELRSRIGRGAPDQSKSLSSR